MSVRSLLSCLLWVFVATGCVHAAPVARVTASEPPAPPRPGPVVAPAFPAPVLHDVGWQLRSGDSTSWSEAARSLHPFTVGHWECALGEVLGDDSLTADALELRRTRRLACTHVTGATVRTQLACTLRRERAPTRTASDPTSATRELQLQLDATPTVHVRCAPTEVRELALVSRDQRPLALLCAGPSGIGECSARSASPASDEPR